MLVVKNLSCSINGRSILSEIDFSIERGEYAVLVGANGVGKTTLLRCVDRAIDGWTGEIWLDGKEIRRYSRRDLARKVALVRQSPEASFSFSVRQFVEFGRYPYLKPFSPISERDERIVERSLERLEIDALAERRLESLSGGERQKVFLAAALAQEPEFLLLDEPTTFLDYRRRSEISRFLRRINEENGTTILEISHDLNHAAICGRRLLALSDGRIVFDGSPQNLMRRDVLRRIFATDFELVRHPRLDLAMILPDSATIRPNDASTKSEESQDVSLRPF